MHFMQAPANHARDAAPLHAPLGVHGVLGVHGHILCNCGNAVTAGRWPPGFCGSERTAGCYMCRLNHASVVSYAGGLQEPAILSRDRETILHISIKAHASNDHIL